MAANDGVGRVSKMVFKVQSATDTTSREITLNNKFMPFDTATYSKVYDTSKAPFGKVQGQIFSPLSYTTWQDTILITNISVAEEASS